MNDSAKTTDTDRQRATVTSRRTVMTGIVGVGVGVPVLAACGGSDATGGSSGSGGGGSGAPEGAVAKTSEIPEGSGKIFAGDKVVVTQPTAGTFKAFDATCTHQGCLVSKISEKTIDCTCHGSKFSVTDGSVVNGPATDPLRELRVTQSGGEISVS